MTTIIGVAGKDPDTLESYVIIAADSRGTSMRGNAPVDDDKKVFGNSSSNYALGTAGKVLYDYFPENSTLSSFLNNPKEERRKTIENTLENMNEIINAKGDGENQYLVSLREDTPELFTFYNGHLINAGAYKIIGSGELFNSSLKSLKVGSDKRVHISKCEAIEEILKAMNEVALKDTYTGGHLDVTIITPSIVVYKKNYAEIKNSSKSNIPVFYKDIREDDAFTHPHNRELD